MAGRGARSEWPIVTHTWGNDAWLFSDGHVPPAFAHVWYDRGDTGFPEQPDPKTAVTLLAVGPYSESGAEIIREREDIDDLSREESDRFADRLLASDPDTTVMYRELKFDPRHTDLVDKYGTNALDEARGLAEALFAASGITRPGQ